jgi:hypothetical protein
MMFLCSSGRTSDASVASRVPQTAMMTDPRCRQQYPVSRRSHRCSLGFTAGAAGRALLAARLRILCLPAPGPTLSFGTTLCMLK